jgi:hypothetical protein
MREILVLLSLFSLVIYPYAGKADINGYDALANWLDLPNDKTDRTPGIASSYDRSGGNNDYNYYYQPTGLQTGDVNTVIAELTGPGMITRFWMPHATANAVFPIKITVDGTVVVNTNSNTFLDGLYSYFKPPLIYTLAGGQVSYEPILFQNSLKIESHSYTNINWAKYHHYYQYNYTRFAPDKTVVPCTGALTMDQISSRNVAAQMLASAGSNPAGTSSTSIFSQNYDFEVPAGTSRNIANVLTGGYIRSIHLRIP